MELRRDKDVLVSVRWGALGVVVAAAPCGLRKSYVGCVFVRWLRAVWKRAN
jgi:hypothetical protein